MGNEDPGAAKNAVVGSFVEIGVGEHEAALLYDGGVRDLETLAGMDVEGLVELKGIGKARAEKIAQAIEAWKGGRKEVTVVSVPVKKALGILRSAINTIVRTPTALNGNGESGK